MSLQASMWTGVSGLLAHGEKMNVVGNNIANVSTVGFKGQRMDFADFIYADTFGNSGLNQIGRGVKLGTIMGNFGQGAYETTTNATDLAISGAGFFKVGKIGSDQAYYTRAGNLSFTSDGYLVDPNGLALQGWRVDNRGGVRQAAGGTNLSAISNVRESAIVGSGAPTDIKLDTWTVLPQQTTNVQFKVNLPNTGLDQHKSSTNPFFSLMELWDGSQPPLSPNTPPMPNSAAAYQTSIEVYDEAGTKHTLTVYYDRVSNDDFAGGDSSQSVWEYVVTMDPAEDQRMYFDTNVGQLVRVNTTEMGGMLMSGTVTFAANGSMVNMSSYTWGGTQSPETNPHSFKEIEDPADPLRTLQVISLNPDNMNNWYPAAVSTNGLPIFLANFSGVLDAQTAGSPRGYQYNIELDFGVSVSNLSMPWQNSASIGQLSVAPHTVNTSFKPDGSMGPEFILLNANYDPTTSDDLWNNPDKLQYVLTGTESLYNTTDNIGYGDWATSWGVAEWSQYRAALMALTGTDQVTIPAGTTFGTTDASGWVFTLGEADIDPATGTLLPGITLSYFDGTSNLTLNAGDPEYADAFSYLQSFAEPKLAAGTLTDRTQLQSATPANANNLANITRPVIISSHTSTNNSGSFSYTMSQDGFGFGDLSSYYFDSDGILYGVYSNGVTLPLWQVTLYDFVNQQGLRREGNNLFSQTRDSGEAKSGPAGNAGLGTISGYSLEQSNVDMATEFVQMISTQRGFQANSKVVTTTDTMLETVIQMKR